MSKSYSLPTEPEGAGGGVGALIAMMTMFVRYVLWDRPIPLTLTRWRWGISLLSGVVIGLLTDGIRPGWSHVGLGVAYATAQGLAQRPA